MESYTAFLRIINDLPWYRKIEVLRIALDLTQAEAAEMCGTTQKGYWSWSNGKRYPRRNNRKAISAAFGVPEYEIFPVTNEKKGA